MIIANQKCFNVTPEQNDIEDQRSAVETDNMDLGDFKKSEVSNTHDDGTCKKDYYRRMSCVKEVRPITITENLEWENTTCIQRSSWWIATCIQILTLTILSLRTDRLLEWNEYLKQHWKHYSGNYWL